MFLQEQKYLREQSKRSNLLRQLNQPCDEVSPEHCWCCSNNVRAERCESSQIRVRCCVHCPIAQVEQYSNQRSAQTLSSPRELPGASISGKHMEVPARLACLGIAGIQEFGGQEFETSLGSMGRAFSLRESHFTNYCDFRLSCNPKSMQQNSKNEIQCNPKDILI